jgi:hypothetical protein
MIEVRVSFLKKVIEVEASYYYGDLSHKASILNKAHVLPWSGVRNTESLGHDPGISARPT